MTASDWLEKVPEEFRGYAREFAAMKCDEMREIIYNYQIHKHGAVMTDVKDSIYNAPYPNLD